MADAAKRNLRRYYALCGEDWAANMLERHYRERPHEHLEELDRFRCSFAPDPRPPGRRTAPVCAMRRADAGQGPSGATPLRAPDPANPRGVPLALHSTGRCLAGPEPRRPGPAGGSEVSPVSGPTLAPDEERHRLPP